MMLLTHSDGSGTDEWSLQDETSPIGPVDMWKQLYFHLCHNVTGFLGLLGLISFIVTLVTTCVAVGSRGQ